MATREEVEQFLNSFKVKLDIWGIVFLDDREKNIRTLKALNLAYPERLKAVRSIVIDDYSEGPLKDQLNGFGEMWVFGKDIHHQEVYVKVSLGLPERKTICISFHTAEHRMNYPFRTSKEE